MSNHLFGTDGLRGQVNLFPMLPEVALRLGLAAGTYFRKDDRRHRVVIGKDTRLSGYIFEYALTSGFTAAGLDVYLVGPMPTPAIAFLTRNMRADLGVVISASHNPFMDNGIKLFTSEGYKLPGQVEDDIAAMVSDPDYAWNYPSVEEVGRARRIADSAGRYLVYLKHSLPGDMTFDDLKVVLDCANGADYKVAPLLFTELGAKVIEIGSTPDGLNINHQCGSLYPEMTVHTVLETGADIGIALDGDGDRLTVIDENGRVLDGDQIMAICAKDMLDKNQLPGRLLVATIMSNMALQVFMNKNNGRLIRTPVGDRFVAEAMRREGAALGGEQSGHIIFSNYGTTGDGLLAALQLIRIMKESGKPLSELAGLLTPFPQVLKNIHVERKVPFDSEPAIRLAVEEAERALGENGRVLLRYSGTESVARIMVEGQDAVVVNVQADKLVQIITACFN